MAAAARVDEVARLAPVGERARIAVLDMLRGIAILGIFYMNIPFMGGTLQAEFFDPRLDGWSRADQWTWSTIQIFADGTQRGMLEMLFGAGMVILTAKGNAAGLYMRRTLWLLVFGLIDVFLFLWPGDILHTYAIAALFLLPFRGVRPRTLILLGLLWGTLGLVNGGVQYADRVALIRASDAAHVARMEHRPLSAAQQNALLEWRKTLAETQLSAKQQQDMATEARARRGGFAGYAAWLRGQWLQWAGQEELAWVIEAFSTMLIGIALYRWGFIQGQRDARSYAITMAIAYAFGLGARAIGVAEQTSFMPIPKTIWATAEYARLAVTIGHIALINLLAKSRVGGALLHPFQAAGRTAFSLYVAQTFIGMWLLFPGFGLGLWGRFGHAALAGIATLTILCLLIAANLYCRCFAMGPLEWAWRSLAYRRRQRFRRLDAPPPALVIGP